MRQPASAAPTGGALPPLLSGSVYTVLLIAGAVILFVFFVSAAVHMFLRFLSRHRSSPPAATSPRLFLLLRSPSSTSSYSSSSSSSSAKSFRPPPPPIDVLPLFTLASSVATVPRLALECAVCLSRFRPDDELRLLPACRHAFHSACIEACISSSLSCPLCRSPIFNEPSTSNLPRAGSSGSFRVEIGSVSRRSAAEGQGAPAAPQRTSSLSFSLGSSFEYVVEEDVEAVIATLADQVRRQRRQGKDLRSPAPPGDEVAESAGRTGDSKNWLRGYLDRLASSASSSFSSLRFSARSSRRMDGASPVAAAAAAAGGGVGWDPEGSSRWRGEAEETAGTYYNAFYRWLAGA